MAHCRYYFGDCDTLCTRIAGIPFIPLGITIITDHRCTIDKQYPAAQEETGRCNEIQWSGATRPPALPTESLYDRITVNRDGLETEQIMDNNTRHDHSINKISKIQYSYRNNQNNNQTSYNNNLGVKMIANHYCTMQTQSKIMSTINQFVEKVKKKSYFIEEHLHNDRYTPPSNIQLLDPLNNLSTRSSGDIYKLVDQDLNQMTKNIIDTVTNGISGSGEHAGGPSKLTHPVLKSIAAYYFDLKGKRIRPTILLLLARALSIANSANPANQSAIQPSSVQMRLAEIVEMIHTASLVHDDVIDDADTRRDVPSINHTYSNKLAILCGDFLLSRASVLLSTLKNHEVTELMSTVISDLVEGEFMQIKASGSSFDIYIRKTYLKTASLIANSCRSTAILSGSDRQVIDIATDFGKNLGLAFQIVDDLLDFTSSTESLGKPASVDLSLGLATAPVLFAAQEFPELETLIERKFSMPGDVDEARRLVFQSNGIEKTRSLAIDYCNKAIQSLMLLPPSEPRDLLITLTHTVVTRKR
ncbi:trans-prenyltransferase [Heterostelium album PN500]|uniref:Trans-prenyltransferase n=1 Tax=Heterostelium pallidum (strain ATCC 26659 / Pp 5 / PN500) TaxID=670386 RepID=D3BB15_HETP5|nr:trans-prenyltransferase [Heterostelium album PN500]EFA81752.1 trans-prenyltransferase [Heterostelium album PN500]|eukprot:XP_020433869.1 trans-prenyltransferase [Heterostelium album PN500]